MVPSLMRSLMRSLMHGLCAFCCSLGLLLQGTELSIDHPSVRQLKEEGLGPLVTRGADDAFGLREGGSLEDSQSRKSGDMRAARIPGSSGLPGLLVSQV